ncbi:lipase 1 [Drosophila ficusphila]|uniref:lipase 1 n=1 Tax=Drosophila ficusphila TaxID=30025 RepID=UPI0007E6DE54|nr:lipase 1 [Drosophila ficusphila]
MFRNFSVNYFCGSLVCLLSVVSIVQCDIIKVHKNILEDANLITPDLIKKYGYPAETHKIQAKDGFVLTAHRIPKPGAQPVLMVHGLFDSSVAYVILGPKRSLGFLLSDLGYDIWLLNTRGNRYSRKHKRFHRYQPQFWDFSFHELGIYDLPAAIDYVLAKSKGFDQVHYVGHSQGTTSFFAMGSERPAYMKKIKLMQALAPVAFWDNIDSPIILTFVKYLRPLTSLARLFGIYELFPENDVWRRLVNKICSFALQNTCAYLIQELMGVDYQQFNTSLVPLFTGHAGAGSSLKSVEHYGQQIHSGGFFKFNYYNTWENRRRHGADTPPQYKLTNVDCKVALYYSKNDRLSSEKDVFRLRDLLPNVVHDYLIPEPLFNHVNFIWGNDVKTVLYDRMLEVMRQVDSGEL